MARTFRNETDGTFSYSAGWSALTGSTIWGTTPTSPANSGTVKFTATAGATCDNTLPANHGFNWAFLIGHGASTNTTNASISVDGTVVQAVWNMKFGIASNANYYQPRILSQPIPLNPAKSSSQVTRLTAGADGLNTIIDGIYLFTSETPTVDEVLGFGHSFIFSFGGGGASAPTQNPHRLNLLIANYLGSTEVNHGIPGESLCFGDYHSVNPFECTQYWNNQSIYCPGWMRAESGTAWPNPGPAQGVTAPSALTVAQTGAFGPQWWARKPRIALVMHGYNDTFYSQCFDPGGFAIPAGYRDAAGHTTSVAASGAGSNVASGVRTGYALSVFFQRLCDMQGQMQANSPQTETYYFGPSPGWVLDSGNYTAAYSNVRYLWSEYGKAMQQMTALPWVKNAYYVDLLQPMTNRGGQSLYVPWADFAQTVPDLAHPNDLSQFIMFAEWKRLYESLHDKGGRAASRVA